MTQLTDSATSVAELKARILAFVRERDWEQFHAPKNLSMALAAEAAELMEHFLWATPEQSKAIAQDPAKRAKIAEELADIVIYALEFANATGLDVASTIEAQMIANGKKYPVEKAKGRADKYTRNSEPPGACGARTSAPLPILGQGSALAAEADVVVEVEEIREAADIVPFLAGSLDHAGEPFVALGAARAMQVQPVRPAPRLPTPGAWSGSAPTPGSRCPTCRPCPRRAGRRGRSPVKSKNCRSRGQL